MDLWQHLRAIWHHRWRVLLVSIVLAGAVYAYSASRDEVFQSTAKLQVTAARVMGAPADPDNTVFLAQSYAELAETETVSAIAAENAEAADLSISSDDADDRSTVAVTGESGFLTIEATGPSAKDAAALATAMTSALQTAVSDRQTENRQQEVAPLVDEIAQVELQLSGLDEDDPTRRSVEVRYETLLSSLSERNLQPVDQLDVVAPAQENEAPVAPTPIRDAILAFLVALIVNAELSVLLTVMRGRFTGSDASVEISELTGLPVLARIPRGGGPHAEEAFRALRTNLIFGDRENLRTLAVVGAEPGCGKSYTSINLARAVAALGVRVVLIDADLRRPVIHRQLHVSQSPGITDMELDGSPVAQLVPDETNLWVVAAGPPTTDPGGFLSSRLRTLFRTLDWAELIIVDSPAAELFSDATAIAPLCDATIVVIDAVSTRRQSVMEVLEALRRVQANPVGVVVNRVSDLPRSSYYDRYTRALEKA